MPMQFQSAPGQAPRQQQQMQSGTQGKLPNGAELIALSIATLGKQLGELADLEKDVSKSDRLRTESAEIIRRAMNIVHHDKMYITAPPGWEPPNMLEPCPSCQHMRSKGERP